MKDYNVTAKDYTGLNLKNVGKLHLVDASIHSEFPFHRFFLPNGIREASATDLRTAPFETLLDKLITQLDKEKAEK